MAIANSDSPSSNHNPTSSPSESCSPSESAPNRVCVNCRGQCEVRDPRRCPWTSRPLCGTCSARWRYRWGLARRQNPRLGDLNRAIGGHLHWFTKPSAWGLDHVRVPPPLFKRTRTRSHCEICAVKLRGRSVRQRRFCSPCGQCFRRRETYKQKHAAKLYFASYIRANHGWLLPLLHDDAKRLVLSKSTEVDEQVARGIANGLFSPSVWIRE